MPIFSHLRAHLRSFVSAKGGNIAVILALSAIPLTLALGAGVDYARGLAVHYSMADALDAAALAVGNQPSKPTTCPSSVPTDQLACASLQSVAQQFFAANYKRDSGSTGNTPTVTLTITQQSVTLNATDSVPTTFLRSADVLLHSNQLDNMAITANSTVVWGQTKLWVSLVLDNTGSMCEPDSQTCTTDANTGIKINALKSASHSLLSTLQNASTTPGDVMVAIVPFAKDVNVGTANVGASWIDWTDWSASMPSGDVPDNAHGPGDDCPFSSTYNDCLTQPGGVLNLLDKVTMTTTSTIPSSGTYSGYICPGSISSSSVGQTGHYYNGCFTSTKVTGSTVTLSPTGSRASCSGYSSSNCSCTGSNSSKVCKTQKWNHTWVLNTKSTTWRGCVMDRDQTDDADDTTPGTKFPAENDDSCPYAAVTQMTNPAPTTTAQMTTMFTNLNTQIDNMVANGGTNQTIGLAHGMQMLVSGLPYSAPTLPANTTRYIILLSDGENTMDRWYGNGSSESTPVDNRMAAACTQAKSEGFVIYTIFVDLGSSGNQSVLSTCATDTSKFYHLTTPGAIITTFNDIAQQITNLRVRH